MENRTLTMHRSQSFGKRFWPLFGLGLLGFIGIAPTLISREARYIATLHLYHPSLWLHVTFILLGASLPIAITVAIGCATAPRLGLRSRLVERFTIGEPLLAALSDELPLALKVGLITSVLTALARLLFRLAIGGHPLAANSITSLDALFHHTDPLFCASIIQGLVYRWGLLSLLAWILWKWLGWPWAQNDDGSPRSGMMWFVILLSALAFGALRLHPAFYTLPLTPLRVAHSLVVNGIFGVGAGWLFWKRSLEAGMMAQVAYGLVGIVLTMVGLPI